MTATVSFLVFAQAFGACVGAFTAVWGEFAYMRARRDGKIDVAERAHLRIIANGLRFGMSLLLLSSFGLVVVAYMLHATLQPALTPTYWTLIALSLFVIGAAWALSRRHVSFTLGSAAVFSAWWFLVYLTLGWLPPLSFGAAVAFFAVATALFYAVLWSARRFSLRK
jgi:hypothetical protein